jgi:REP element-mobilizing transposase RayT
MYPGAFYHVTCRGNERKEIFLDDKDRSLFLDKLLLSCNIFNVPVLSYVLMNNHFHMLLTTPDGNLSDFMRHFNISYTSSFNRRHKRVGHLYQGRYKSFLVDADSYLLELSRYIHLNPVRIKTERGKSPGERWRLLSQYKWSSLEGYMNKGKRKSFVNYEMVLNYVGGDNRKGRSEYIRFIRGGLDRGVKSPLEEGKGTGIVGSEDFIEIIKDKFFKENRDAREQPQLREIKKVIKPEDLIDYFLEATDLKREAVCVRGKNSLDRAILMEFLYRYCKITQPEIGEYFGGIDYSAVSQARIRLQKKMQNDKKAKMRFDELANKIDDLSRLKI